MKVYEQKRVGSRAICCAFYLGLLAVCGYIGGHETPVQTVSVAVTRAEADWTYEQQSASVSAARLSAQRQEEITMLRAVTESESAPESTRADAQRQLMQIADRMEYEAQAQACLVQMGYDEAYAICGAQMMTLLLPQEKGLDEADRVRIVEAVSSLTGLHAGDIKIILTKK